MRTIVQIDGLQSAISDMMKEYGDECTRAVREIVPEVAKDTVKELKKKKSFATKSHATGKYAKAWKTDVVETRISSKARIYNSTEYQLTHLLEFGHAKRGGGRVPAYEHIGPQEEWANEEVVRRLEERLKG